MIHGIDVSKYQGKIDWQRVKSSGVRFVAVRASIGTVKADETFAENFDNARAAGLDVTFYHVVRQDADARQQYDFLRKTAGTRWPDLPPVLDVELPAQGGVAEKLVTLKRAVEMGEMIKQDYRAFPIIYTAAWWFDGVYTAYKKTERALFDWVTARPLWIASYTPQPRTLNAAPSIVAIWQYTSEGRVDGINAQVDRDLFVGGDDMYDALKATMKRATKRVATVSADWVKITVEEL